jgi:hypothetical protein
MTEYMYCCSARSSPLQYTGQQAVHQGPQPDHKHMECSCIVGTCLYFSPVSSNIFQTAQAEGAIGAANANYSAHRNSYWLLLATQPTC